MTITRPIRHSFIKGDTKSSANSSQAASLDIMPPHQHSITPEPASLHLDEMASILDLDLHEDQNPASMNEHSQEESIMRDVTMDEGFYDNKYNSSGISLNPFNDY